MPSSLKDVAALAGVSITTASRALNGKGVNVRTRERILEAVKKLKYHPSAIGKNLINNKSNTIGMYILNTKKSRDMTEEISYYYAMMKGALSCIRKYEYVFNFEVLDWEDLDVNNVFAKKIYGRTIDGLILVPQFMYHYSFLNLLEEERFPFVIIDPKVGIKPENSVSVDNYRGGYLAADYLLSLGHSRIAFINGPESHIDSQNREKGFLSRLLGSSVRFGMSDIIYSDFTNEGGYEAAKRILSDAGRIPSAIFCANDYMASGALAAVSGMGLRVPGDVSLMGYDDTDIARCIFPKLTTIRTAVKDIGFLAAERVLNLIAKAEKQTSETYPEIILEPTLVVRDSTRKI
jgi:DNA-binding LacI/PurR family transcriptional regulator